ncbi:MAG: pseudouridine synthase [Chloroflexi bacterium]|nr:pseudouridine synthase [Chloroflexota bacterium]
MSAAETGQVRLQVALARAGIASRRAAAQAIVEGRVSVNGEIAREPGRRVDPSNDEIRIDDIPIDREPLRYYALHKPLGVLSAASDDRGRPTVTKFLPSDAGRCVPVGRLDLESEGLLLLTNDGPLINSLLHPSNRLPREYIVELRGRPSDNDLERVHTGVRLDDGVIARANPKRLRRPSSTPGTSWLRLTLHQGRKREIRRICEAIGYPVVRLIRVRFGPIRLRDLGSGQLRPLTDHEVRLLRARVPGPEPAQDTTV